MGLGLYMGHGAGAEVHGTWGWGCSTWNTTLLSRLFTSIAKYTVWACMTQNMDTVRSALKQNMGPLNGFVSWRQLRCTAKQAKNCCHPESSRFERD